MNFKDALRTLKFKKNTGSYHQLYTKWGEELDTTQVLMEYPRPQFRRNSYINLNGYWDYEITKESVRPEKFEGKILVPFSPESVLSGVNRQLKPDEYLWYERKIHIKHKPFRYRCLLHFGAVDQCCEVYLNNEKVTEHIGGYLPFYTDITSRIKAGENRLTVKVKDVSDRSYHSRGKQKLDRGGMFYTAQSGIWQTVWMEWVPDRYLEEVHFTPLFDSSLIRIELKMNEKDLEEIYHIEIFASNKRIKTITRKEPIIEIEIPDMKTWSPEQPFLYDCVITVGEDCIKSYFAMRKIEIKKDAEGIAKIFLNNQEYFQNGLLDQGYWPDGLYTAPSDDALLFDISKAKELGFNMIRKHIKIEPLRWYYHCDKLGMLVWQDMVNGGEKYNESLVGHLPTLFPSLMNGFKDKHYSLLGRKNEEGRKEWTRECMETVNLLYNSPSVVVWVPFNEGWGQFDGVKAYELIRNLDETRLIDHASGWFNQKIGDFKSIHNYFHPLKVIPEKRPVILSEFGGYACYIKEHSYSWQIYGYRIYLTKEDLNKDIQKLYTEDIEKLKREGLAASVYTQLSDVEDEVNGLLTYDRKVCKIEPLPTLFSLSILNKIDYNHDIL